MCAHTKKPLKIKLYAMSSCILMFVSLIMKETKANISDINTHQSMQREEKKQDRHGISRSLLVGRQQTGVRGGGVTLDNLIPCVWLPDCRLCNYILINERSRGGVVLTACWGRKIYSSLILTTIPKAITKKKKEKKTLSGQYCMNTDEWYFATFYLLGPNEVLSAGPTVAGLYSIRINCLNSYFF